MAIHLLSKTDEWKASLKDQWQLVVIGAVEEEAATSKGARFVKECYQPQYCIIGEPSGWKGVTLGYKGRLRMDYHCAEDMAHSAGPESGIADHAFEYWQAIKKYTTEWNKDKKSIFYQLQSRIDQINTSIVEQQNTVKTNFAFR